MSVTKEWLAEQIERMRQAEDEHLARANRAAGARMALELALEQVDKADAEQGNQPGVSDSGAGP